jgi:putative phosphoribosyl transferase
MGLQLFYLIYLQKKRKSDKNVEKIQNQVPGLTLNKFNIPLLANRLIKATEYLLNTLPNLKEYNIGYFGASTGTAAALIAAVTAELSLKSNNIKTIVSRGGRPDLVLSTSIIGNNLSENIKNIPILFVIGEKDKTVLELTLKFIKKYRLRKNSRIEIVKGATHLFEEDKALEQVSDISYQWLVEKL